jgi:cytochrome b561
MLAMPLSGWLMSSAGGYPITLFGLFEVPALVPKGDPIGHWAKEVHELGLWAFISLLSLHIAAAIQHHFLHADNTLKRILFRR